MTSLRSTLFSVALLLSVIIASEAKIETLKVAYDTRNVFHIESFGFEPGGHFELNIKDFKVLYDATLVKEQEDYRTAFVLQRAGSDEGVRIEQTYQTEDTCFHESVSEADDATVFLLKKADWDANKKFVQEIKEPGYYHLYFSRCDKATVVSFEIQFVEYNVEADGRTPNYLSAGESSLPTWFFVISLAFVIEGVIWIQYLIRRREDIRSIHHLMTAVLFLKLATVFFESFEYHYIKTTGSAHGWNIVYYIFSFLKGMMMFGVIVLIGTGWSYMKPFLTERDKQLMLAVIVIQGMVNLAAVVLDETSPGDKDFLTWRDLLHLLDMVCCCFILLPIVWSIRHLKEAAEVDGKAARNVLRLQRFRKFYVSVVSYIYFTRIIVFLLGATLPFEWVWVATVFRELAALLFYGTTGYLFRPQSNNPYLEISQDDEGPDSASDSVQMTSVMRE